jgi:acetyltransferase-like isoleucine patch superfamily enzyme
MRLLERTRLLLKLFGENFADEKFPVKLLWRHVFIQKICGFNRHVPWPVHWTSQVKCPQKINKGSRMPGLSLGCYLDGRNGISFGDNTWVGPGVKIISMNHESGDYNRYVYAEPIKIGKDCWIAANAIILPGVKLGDHTVVAAGAVVTQSFPDDNQLIGGVPAKLIKNLPPYAKR